MRAIARQLIAAEKPRSLSAERDGAVEFRATDRLRPHLSTLMGRNGFQALLARALVLTSAEVPWLGAVKVVGDGEIEGLAAAQSRSGGADYADGEVVLLAQLLGLLVAFIGPALTARLIGELWPQLALTGADFDKAAT
jgi:hypothetical protein